LYFQVRKGKKIKSKYIGRYSYEKLQEAIKSIEERNQLYQDYQFLKKEEKILKRVINAYEECL
jgi:hypothetical protein